MARRIASDEELDQFQKFFDRWGGIAIIVSRIMPILPEIMALLASPQQSGDTYRFPSGLPLQIPLAFGSEG